MNNYWKEKGEDVRKHFNMTCYKLLNEKEGMFNFFLLNFPFQRRETKVVVPSKYGECGHLRNHINVVLSF